MLKLTWALIFIFMMHSAVAQEKPLTASEKAALDSMLNDDLFLDMLNTALSPKSYFLISAGIGNSYFSIRNRQVNAMQMESKLVFTPSAAYYHKSGFGIVASAFHSSFDNKSGFYQFSASPSFSFTKNKKVKSVISYTHIFTRAGFEKYASPVKHELYGNIYLKKPWLQPGVAIGFSGGRETEYRKVDTVLNGTRRVFTDTVKSRLNIFSVSAFIQHVFEFYELLSKKDGLSITPQLMLNAGSQRYTETHQNPFLTRLQSTNITRFKNLGRLNETSSFSIQSVAFSLNMNYMVGRFGFEPQAYLDYYIPSTTDKKFTVVCSFAVSFNF